MLHNKKVYYILTKCNTDCQNIKNILTVHAKMFTGEDVCLQRSIDSTHKII